MNRHALRSALGRATPSTTARALILPVSTTTPTSFFSTTASRPDDANSNSSGNKPRSQSAAVSRLSQLNNNSSFGGGGGGGERRSALDSIPGLSSSSSSSFSRGPIGPRRGGARGGGGIDARSLRVSPDASGPSSSGSGPRVLNLRSLRGSIRSRTPFGRGGGVGGRFAPSGGEGGGSFGRPRVGFGAGGPRGGGGGFGRGRFGGGDGGGSGFGGRSRGGRGRGRGRGGARGRMARGSPRDDKKEFRAGEGKLVWTPEEKEVIDRLEKGDMVPFDPKVTLDSLTGYGAAMATDAPIGQVETALRAMRLMTGGMAFNPESGVTADVKDIMKKYRAKKPIFVHSKEEKAWIESAQPRLRLVGPDAGTKKAIIEPAILGKYEATKFAEAGDVAATMANYHARTFTYMASDSQKFMDKVLSLLPAQQGGRPAAQAKP